MADKVVARRIADLAPYARNNRRHSSVSVRKLMDGIKSFGFVSPILVDGEGVIIAGHGRVEAARLLGLTSVPTVTIEHLSGAQIRALRIADNRLAELSSWDEDNLRLEFADLIELNLDGSLDLDVTITGFEMPVIDLMIRSSGIESEAPTETVEEPDPAAPIVTRPGDLWKLGHHRLFCGSSLDEASWTTLMGEETPRMAFTDPPYNVPVNGHVRSGRSGGHREFAMASGEMSETEFAEFLVKSLGQLHARLVAGGVAMVCIDWRHVAELIAAGRQVGFDLINLCVWNKTNGGMGSLYRSKHELICIFRKHGASHLNNVELGRHGRNRTNVWDYAGVNSFGAGRDADLADHPTVKPTALVADALMDVSNPGDIVIDGFGGSGATLLAAEKTGRRARLIELDPAYVDVAIRRWQTLTGQSAIHAPSGETFDIRAAAALAPMEASHAPA
ncbi:methyltransferase [Wenxinia marina]|nr:DNA methyltransferase [Wenxinia marina]GGL50720.1 methyltransferase [Wenxinia marina]